MKDQKELLEKAQKEGIPAIVLIGTDKCALSAIRAYQVECIKSDCDGDFLEELCIIEDQFSTFAETHETKIPD